MKREQYSPEIIAMASMEIAQDPEVGGNSSLAKRVQETIDAGEDPFHLVFRAIKNGQSIMERAERIRREQLTNGRNGIK